MESYETLRLQEKSRWATRGWTFQEEALSKRLLCYTTGRIIWHCQAGMAIEPGEEPGRDRSAAALAKNATPEPASHGETADPKAAAYAAWYKLLEAYTRRCFTFDDDRLPAIGAFARSFRARLGDQYCAGLWRGDLNGLLFNAAAESDGWGPPGSPLLRAWLRISYHESEERPTRR